MSKFWASSSSSSSDDDSASDSDGSIPGPTIIGALNPRSMSKFWASKSSSSSSDDDSDKHSVDSSAANSVTGPIGSRPSVQPTSHASPLELDPFSTPPRQPTLPVDDPAESWERIRAAQVFTEPPSRTGPRDRSAGTRISCVSDTHGYHRSVPIPHCDVLVHGGDFTNYGEPEMVADVSAYFSDLLRSGRVREGIVCIAGNHELTFEPDHYDRVWRRFRRPRQEGKFNAGAARMALKNCAYLEDEAATVGPVRFYGSPWQPEFFDWAFNAPRAEIRSKWERIPSDTDVLITHGPPLGRGDAAHGRRVGCVSLMREVQSRIRPRLHVFGHIHEGYGVTHDGTTMYVNASSVSHNYTRVNNAVVVDLPHNESMPAQLVNPECRLDASGLLKWLGQNGYTRTATRLREIDCSVTGADILEGSHRSLCCRLLIHRDEEAKAELKQAKTKLWSESFH